jgi:hypothetical protein
MSDEISEGKEARLRRLYSQNDNRPFFDWAALRQNDSRETSVDTMMRCGRLYREAAVGLLQELAQAGFGTFYIGRRGAKTRIAWNYSLRDIGAAARGAIQGVGEIDQNTVEEPTEDDENGVSTMIEHTFNLRPGIRISIALPEDLTRREAERLGAFIQTLPLGE